MSLREWYEASRIATPGPWDYDHDDGAVVDHLGECLAEPAHCRDYAKAVPDGKFISLSRTAADEFVAFAREARELARFAFAHSRAASTQEMMAREMMLATDWLDAKVDDDGEA